MFAYVLLLVKLDNTAEVELEMGVDVISKTEPFEDTTSLSCSTVPFHRTVHELVLKLLGTWSHMRRSCFPSTGKPLETVALPCTSTEYRNLPAWSLMLNAWTWKITWMEQWTTEKMK